MKKISAIMALLLGLSAVVPTNGWADTAEAEIFQGGSDPEVQRVAPSADAHWSVVLPELPAASTVTAKTASTLPSNQPLQVGIGRDVPPDQASVLSPETLGWSPTADGGQVALLSLTSEGAQALRIALQVYAMPDPAQLRFFAPDRPDTQVFVVSGAEINVSLAADRASRDADASESVLYWPPIVEGDTEEIEIYLPPGVPVSGVRFAIPQVSHFLLSPSALMPTPKGVTDSGSCTKDVSCYMDTWGDVANAVARMIFTENGASFLCSGSLINDRDTSSQIPYFITARHCISTQSVASTLQTYWFFRTISCEGPFEGSNIKVLSGGSTMLITVPSVDITLVRLNGTPPEGTTMVGWDTNQVPRETRIGSVSHPQGDLQKLALGAMHGYVGCYFSSAETIQGCGTTVSDTGNFMVPSFDFGMVQRGSSGSGLFLDDSHKLVGIASNASWEDTNGNSSIDCGETVFQDSYGRFDVAYESGIKRWLDVTHACSAEPGDWAYCSNPACGPCAEGKGDCDSDQECQPGLVCSQNVGARYGWDATMDVCETPGTPQPTGGCQRQPGDWDYCADPDCGPCAAGQGDCDNNSECQAGLICLPDTGAAYGFPATVATCGLPAESACTLTPGDWGYCSDPHCGPCRRGVGDCDGDAECNPGLVCRSNVGPDYGLPPTMDVCVLPTESSCTKSPGDWGYCSDPACGPCPAGLGDCDTDADCVSGLSCSFNAGEKYGLPATMDVCEIHQP
jgi:hypothetical protein